jgi:hypothetical protein
VLAGCGSGDPGIKGLRPAFSPEISDYVLKCPADGKRKPGEGFTFKQDGKTFHARCLPKDFPRYTAQVSGKRETGYFLVTPIGKTAGNYVALFDADGVPIWWQRSSYRPWDAHALPNGNLAWAPVTTHFGKDPSAAYEEHTLEGKLVHRWKTEGSPVDSHEFFMLEDGESAYMVTYRKRDGVDLRKWGGDRDAEVYDGEVQLVRRDGTVAWRWNAADHISIDESVRWLHADVVSTGWDLDHLNAIVPDGDGILVSTRYTDSIYRIEKSGKIDWKLGGYETPESLKVEGNVLGGQHDVRLADDGTITIFDNSNNRGRAPRALRVKVDAAARTATVLEAISDPTIKSSFCCGSARKLPGGHWAIGWGGSRDVTETTAEGKPVLRISFTDWSSYRAEAIDAADFPRERLRAAMDAKFRVPSGAAG